MHERALSQSADGCINTQTPNSQIEMIMTRWNVAVSDETDQALRVFLASRGGGRKGDLSRFIEESVRARMLELSAEEAKRANADIAEQDIASMVAEALAWAKR